jgi:hypothetical protein
MFTGFGGTYTVAHYMTVKAKFCPDCGTRNKDGGNYCTQCGKSLAQAGPMIPAPEFRPYVPQPQRCAFDGLPPGTYGLVCTCPKCSPRCKITYSSISNNV